MGDQSLPCSEPGCLDDDTFFEYFPGACGVTGTMESLRNEFGVGVFSLGNLVLLPDVVSSLSRTFRETTDIIHRPLDPRCSDFDLDTTGELEHYLPFFIIFVVCIFAGFALYFRRRNIQPIQARPIWVNAMVVVLVVLFFMTVLMQHLASVTAPCAGFLYIMCFFPLLLFLYCMRVFYLIFVYKWSLSKLDAEKLTWHSRHQYLLKPKFFFVLLGAVVITLVLMYTIVMVTEPEVYGAGVSEVESARCEWWWLPADVAASAEEELSALGVPLMHPVDPLTTAATAAIAVGYPSPAAPYAQYPVLVDRVTDTEGALLGYYAVDLDSCQGCVYLHPELLYVMIAIGWLLVVFLFFGAIRIYSLHDHLGLWVELVSWLVVAIPCAVIQMFGLQSSEVWNPSEEIAHPDYIATVVLCVWSFAVSILYPLFLSYAWSGGWFSKTSSRPLSRWQAWTFSYLFGVRARSESRDMSLPFSKSHNSGDSSHSSAIGLDFILDTPAALEEYRRFAVKEFTVENIQFVVAAYNLRFCGDDENRFQNEAQQVYDMFFSPTASQPLNVSAEIVRDVKDAFASPPVSRDVFSETEAEIRHLIVKDSWPRFMLAPEFENVRRISKDTELMQQTLLGSLDQRTTRTRASIVGEHHGRRLSVLNSGSEKPKKGPNLNRKMSHQASPSIPTEEPPTVDRKRSSCPDFGQYRGTGMFEMSSLKGARGSAASAGEATIVEEPESGDSQC
eukprot:Rmarinus@m.5088